MFDSGEASGYDGDVGVGALGGRGTDGLIGAAGAGIAFAREIGFWTRAVFYWGGVVVLIQWMWESVAVEKIYQVLGR